jgi:hypothetical protein
MKTAVEYLVRKQLWISNTKTVMEYLIRKRLCRIINTKTVLEYLTRKTSTEILAIRCCENNRNNHNVPYQLGQGPLVDDSGETHPAQLRHFFFICDIGIMQYLNTTH